MLEVACFNTSSAIMAAESGADRIELCADYAAGGITPSLPTLQDIQKETQTPVNVMIRPRAGDFHYSDTEFHQMKVDIQLFKPLVQGFVFGILDRDHHIDAPRNQALVRLAAPLPCTFHRAFDQVPNCFEGAKALLECGFKSVLTSGGPLNAMAHAEAIGDIHKEFGNRINVIVGGGVRSSNVEALKKSTGCVWFHSAAITCPGEEVDETEVKQLQQLLTATT